MYVTPKPSGTTTVTCQRGKNKGPNVRDREHTGRATHQRGDADAKGEILRENVKSRALPHLYSRRRFEKRGRRTRLGLTRPLHHMILGCFRDTPSVPPSAQKQNIRHSISLAQDKNVREMEEIPSRPLTGQKKS